MSEELVTYGLGKRYRNAARELVALEDISFSVANGEFLTIIGPSGCGKSTLLRCIAGFEKPTSGSVLVGGRTVERPGADRMMVFQGFEQLFPWFTVVDNIAHALRVTGTVSSKSTSRRVASEYLSLVGLSGYENFYPHHLSGGMKQRVAIARALSVKPRVLLMDEPFGSLDALTHCVLQDELIHIWQETGVTILFVTHNIEEAVLQADRIVVLSSCPGRIKAIVPNPLPRPRSPELPEFGELWETLHNLLGFARQPGAGGGPRRRTVFEEADAPTLAMT